MFLIKVKCIKCGSEWDKESTIPYDQNEYTGGLCHVCFRDTLAPLIHKRQLREGSFDCFGKASSFCDQHECKYYAWCVL